MGLACAVRVLGDGIKVAELADLDERACVRIIFSNVPPVMHVCAAHAALDVVIGCGLLPCLCARNRRTPSDGEHSCDREYDGDEPLHDVTSLLLPSDVNRWQALGVICAPPPPSYSAYLGTYTLWSITRPSG